MRRKARGMPCLFCCLRHCVTRTRGVYDQAIQIYYDLLEHDPKHAQAHSNLGFLYAAQGDYEMAHKHYNKSIESSPKNY